MKRYILSFALLALMMTQTKAQKPVANFSASMDTACVGECISLTDSSTNNPTSWLWTFTGAAPSTSTDQNPQCIIYFNIGNHDVKLVVSNLYGSDSITKNNLIAVLPSPPAPTIIQDVCGDSIYCTPDSSYISYQWYQDTVLIPGATTPVLRLVDLFQDYNIAVTNKYGCMIAVGIQGLFEPGAAVCDISCSKNIICKGDCINFYSTVLFQADEQWSFPGANSSGIHSSSPTNICYDTVGIYDVSLSAWNPINGGSTLTKPGFITVLPALPIPIITQQNDTLFCSQDSSYSSYQWYLDSAIINGDTNSFIVVSQSGNYRVQVTSRAGCKALADTTIVLGLPYLEGNHAFSLSPNPATNQLTIHTSSFNNEAVTVSIVNVMGQEASPPATLQRRGESATVDVSGLAAGMYFLQVRGESGSVVKRFVKE